MSIEVDYPEKTDVCVVHLSHVNLDHESAMEIKTLLLELISKNNVKVVMNMDNVETIRSAGLGVLISGMKSLRKNGGDLKLCGVRDNVREILDLTKVSDNLKIFDDQESAAQSYSDK